ncbi:RNA degradosome polyphosphate kinase [Geomicrobium sediminis]|uniref:Polyphosphate kinase n=1 Tax=Geomicrobium sediminis TaxID=1347788 RepID=A0ABS2P6R9_9BACL|nr:RNA degradosome polyphosphate kinase [Geomicrobium sediminis]MBM7631004.1 polyphosphate kinase [Geomicrobium sediminis]
MFLHKKYINREFSWLAFNERVLDEARDRSNPLMERLKFLSITGSNLDEFFMVRVATLHHQMQMSISDVDIAGMTATQQIEGIYDWTQQMVRKQYNTYSYMLLPALKKLGVTFLSISAMSPEQQKKLHLYFKKEIFPVLTPLAVDSSRPFPFVSNQSIHIAVRLQKKDDPTSPVKFATIEVPSVLSRIVQIPYNDAREWVLLEDVIQFFMSDLFQGYRIIESCCYRVIRDMDIEVEEGDAINLLNEMKKQLRIRERGEVLRLDVEGSISKEMHHELTHSFSIDDNMIFILRGPVDLTFVPKLAPLLPEDGSLYYKEYVPYLDAALDDGEIFEQLKEADYLLHHPYESFKPILNLLQQATDDDAVLAIKMTLYRVSGNSPVIRQLERAAKRGKQVTVLLELKARFDEENNILWARQLEKAGCHVIYGVLGLKTHAKLLLVVRRESDGIRRYVHLGTGNYNDQTAKLYTDFGLMTSNRQLGFDVSALFNMLSGFAEPTLFNKLITAPYSLRNQVLEFINVAIEDQKLGKKASIAMKLNSLSDRAIIDALYKASAAGVTIRLLIRGICCLRPNVAGLSENIEVQSIVGRYLEHTRMFLFTREEGTNVYLSSADLMVRNLDARVETMFPIDDNAAKTRIVQMFETMWLDNVKTRILQEDGSYKRVDKRGKKRLDAQAHFQTEAEDKRSQQRNEERPMYPLRPLDQNT